MLSMMSSLTIYKGEILPAGRQVVENLDFLLRMLAGLNLRAAEQEVCSTASM